MNGPRTFLERILDTKREEIAARRARLPAGELAARIAGLPPPRPFAAALRAAAESDGLAVIAEIKRASPSAGVIRADFDPARLAAQYAAGGAACLSVLTDATYFQGHEDHLSAARAACDRPVLRKDFTLDPWQIDEARLIGADAVLLIAAALPGERLAELYAHAAERQLAALVEIHDEAELERALALKAELVGINHRDLRTFVTDLAIGERLAPRIAPPALAIGESGIRNAADCARLWRAGGRAVLIGETFMRAADPGAALAALRRDFQQAAGLGRPT